MIEKYLKEQKHLHPSMKPQDAVKLCFQAAFGAEHLLGDMEKVKNYFDTEFAGVQETDGLLAEFIADDVCRINLAVWKKRGLPSKELFDLFVASASQKRENGKETFWKYMSEAEKLPWTDNEWQNFVEEYKKDGIRAVHHSQTYREQERPAYRIISGHQHVEKFKR
ncbi:MAG: hypothetical protein FWD97_04790 [Defluviitaleaceae bacterium]|nr:hypothetical protein [Defluviitaleaceae bacterium]